MYIYITKKEKEGTFFARRFPLSPRRALHFRTEIPFSTQRESPRRNILSFGHPARSAPWKKTRLQPVGKGSPPVGPIHEISAPSTGSHNTSRRNSTLTVQKCPANPQCSFTASWHETSQSCPTAHRRTSPRLISMAKFSSLRTHNENKQAASTGLAKVPRASSRGLPAEEVSLQRAAKHRWRRPVLALRQGMAPPAPDGSHPLSCLTGQRSRVKTVPNGHPGTASTASAFSCRESSSSHN